MKKEWLLRKNTFEDICHAARSKWPDEFMAMLGSTGKNNVIDEVVVLPLHSDDWSAEIQLDMLPPEPGILGTVHSHPDHNAHPSEEDLRTFARLGRVHLIVAHPFDVPHANFFDARGKKAVWRLVE